MAVWIIPASNSAAQKNYPKTLTAPIGQNRLDRLPEEIRFDSGDKFAWGFPRHQKNLELFREMRAGDLCLFYTFAQGGNGYGWAARVSSVVPEDLAAGVSAAFWDDDGFLPYMLERPIQIRATPKELGLSLSPQEEYMRSHPMGSFKLTDLRKGAHAIEEHGSFDAWAVEFIRRHGVRPLSIEEAIDYVTEEAPRAVPGVMASASDLFRPRPKRVADISVSYKAGGVGRSKEAKAIGDLGEEAVFEHLKATLSEAQRTSLRWVARDGETPGWDIQYLDRDGGLVRVEVKSTTTTEFQAFEMTANEVRAATLHGKHYHLYLVANCRVPGRRRFQVVVDPMEEFEDLMTTAVFRIGG